jgi:hypothetical protein
MKFYTLMIDTLIDFWGDESAATNANQSTIQSLRQGVNFYSEFVKPPLLARDVVSHEQQ